VVVVRRPILVMAVLGSLRAVGVLSGLLRGPFPLTLTLFVCVDPALQRGALVYRPSRLAIRLVFFPVSVHFDTRYGPTVAMIFRCIVGSPVCFAFHSRSHS
jgi:hypothetical protein